MRVKRVDLPTAQGRLESLPTLSGILGPGWLARDYAKPEEQWSLTTGWLSVESNEYWHWLNDLNAALAYLKTKLTTDAWQTMTRKVRAHSNRANSKGLLSEIAVCVFLAAHDIAIELERSLIGGSEKDVDVRATVANAGDVHIEVQWLSPSDESERGAAIAALYDDGYPLHYDSEKHRIKRKLCGKTRKFTLGDVTIVALDCTTAPELGGADRLSVVEEMLRETCEGSDMNGQCWPYFASDTDKAVREYVDGVLWFELQPGAALRPHERGIYLNPTSPHISDNALLRLAELWSASEATEGRTG